ncbi:tetratricopeptide repeat protein [Synoicihabitans lomoniglobus]|uniref:Tetratricopeptide repeat protein n=1 Tax=Synoicihabitans lomoniglobus TaxID=2909285 RepID=A0AAF0CQB0_9BACT|nr:tetratricopeptide repeat protein [Opitutaceae bacterium LMO-M01]WED66082.1 tetratricopeptide repeat protein [Opitutaceae bacterium LMO-M01]
MRKPGRAAVVVVVVGITVIAAVTVPGIVTRQRLASYVPEIPAAENLSEPLRARLIEAGNQASDGEVEGLMALSRLYHANGYTSEAERIYGGLMTEQPENPRWPYRTALLRAANEDFGAAREWLERSVALAPDYAPARLRLAETWVRLEAPAQAASVFRELLEREPDHVRGLLGLARIAVDREAWTDARSGLERVVAATQFAHGVPELARVYENVGETERLQALRGRAPVVAPELAIDDPWMRELVEDLYDPLRLMEESHAAVSRDDKAAAMRWMERALVLAPDNGEVHHQTARLWERLRNQVKALAEYERAAELDPTIDDVWARLVTLYKAIGDTGKARRALTNGLEVNPSSAALLIERGRQLKERGRGAEALADFEKVIELHPQELIGYVEAAQVLFAMKRAEAADGWLEQSLAVAPDNPVALVMLSFSAITQRNRAAADRWMAQVMAQPRVARPDRDRLAAGYLEVFGEPPRG